MQPLSSIWRRSAAPAKAFRDGTHRTCAPEETLARVRPLLPDMGITRIADVTGLDAIGVPVVMVCRPNSRSLSVSQGKGLTLAAARASGVMESIELFHAEHILQPLLLGSYRWLRTSHPLVDVAALPATRNSRFHANLQLLWIEGHDVLHDEPVWVPYEVVHASAVTPAPTGSGCFSSTSNGLASGNDPQEALLHGICEVVERDAASVWAAQPLERREATRIALDTVDDDNCRHVIARCERAGVAVLLWDITSDIGLPAFLCRVVDRRRDALQPIRSFTGMGCHTTRHIALLRALTEAVQSRLTYISGARDDLNRDDYADEGLSEHDVERYLAGNGDARVRSFRDVPSRDSETFGEDLAWVLGQLRGVGVERVIAVDLTRPDLGVPVIRVVIPGLEGPDSEPEYVPGARARAAQEGSR
jgi:ribosomal protein S12 methylthiotransferase accessory factor